MLFVIGGLAWYHNTHIRLRAASGFTGNFQLCVQGHIVCGCICSIAVDNVASVMQEGPSEWHIEWSACCSTRFQFTCILLWCLWSHHLLVWNGRDNENEKKWEVLRMMITKITGKSWGIYSQLQVTMKCVTANLHIVHNMNPAAYSCRLQGFPTVLRNAPSQSGEVSQFTGIYHGERAPKSGVCEISTAHSSMEKTSADVCPKKSPASYMKHMLNNM